MLYGYDLLDGCISGSWSLFLQVLYVYGFEIDWLEYYGLEIGLGYGVGNVFVGIWEQDVWVGDGDQWFDLFLWYILNVEDVSLVDFNQENGFFC